MKFKNIIVSLLIVIFGVVVFTGCNNTVSLALSVNSNQGIVLCDGNDVTSTATYKLKKKSKVTLSAIANTGYAFQGWNNGTTQVSDRNPYEFLILKNTNLTATFYKISYSISFDCAGETFTGSTQTIQDAKIGNTINFPDFTDTESKEFQGWFYGETKISDGGNTTLVIPELSAQDKANSAFTVTAKFETAKTISFDIDGTITSTPCFVGNEIQFPQATKDGYHFSGWQTQNGDAFTATTLTEDADLTLIAVFDKIYTVSFSVASEYEGTYAAPASEEVWNGAAIAIPHYAFTENSESKFRGWEYNGQLYTNTFTCENPTENITLTAKISKRYTITYYCNGGEELAGTYIYQDDNFSELNLPTPLRTAGCSETNSQVPPFRCWTYKNQPVSTQTVFTADHNISLVAQWDIYYIALQYQSPIEIAEGGAVYYIGATADQLVKDVLPYAALEQSSVTSTTQVANASGDPLLFYTLNPNYGYNYNKNFVTDLYLTVEEFCAKARTLAADGVESNGFTYTETLMAEEFVFADDYGTPNVTPNPNGPATYEIANTNWACIIYVSFNLHNDQ